MKKSDIKGIIFRISDDLDEVLLAKVISSKSDWKSMASSLSDRDCYYIVYDLTLTRQLLGLQKELIQRKIAFLTWIPMKSSVKKRMMTASAKAHIKDTLFQQKFEIDWTLDDRNSLELDDRLDDMKKEIKFKEIISIR